MQSLKEQINKDRLPQHVAVIMDGNGRWARMHGKPRIFGHRNGVRAVREVTEAAAEIGVPWLTLYAFSTENWNRPPYEVNALMSLLVETMHKEVRTLNENNIRLNAIGDLKKLPGKTYDALMQGMHKTMHNTRMTLTLALNYSARWEIVEMARRIARECTQGNLNAEELSEDTVRQYLATAQMPDPELMIRTSGEKRISNFLLWQLAYTELYFTEVYWPDFRKEHFYQALIDFQMRERRFGMTSDQLVK